MDQFSFRSALLPLAALLASLALPSENARAADAPPSVKPELPADMKQAGFQLLQNRGGYRLLVPSGVVWDLSASFLTKASDFKFERNGNKITFRVGTANAERAAVNFDLETLRTEYQEFNQKNELTKKSVRSVNQKFADTWAVWGPDGSPLAHSLAEYVSATNTLRIVERNSGKIRNLQLKVPDGVQVNIIEGKFMLLTGTKGRTFGVGDRFAGSGRGCQVLLDLENHLQRNSKTKEPISWAILSDAYAQSQLIGSIQDSIDFVTVGLSVSAASPAEAECAAISESNSAKGELPEFASPSFTAPVNREAEIAI